MKLKSPKRLFIALSGSSDINWIGPFSVSVANELKFLISFEQYTQNYELECPDLEDIKETFALKDHQLYELIEEIYLDKK